MSVFEEIGGQPAVNAVVDDFYDRVLKDPLLEPYFDGIDMERLRQHQRAFIATALGGPTEYRGRSMGEAHAGVGVTGEAFDSVVVHLTEALAAAGVPGETIDRIGQILSPLRGEVVQA